MAWWFNQRKMVWPKFFLTFAIVSLKYDDEVHLKMAISKNTTHFCNSCVGQTYDMNNLKIGYLCKVPQKYKRILFISFLVARRSSNSVLWNLVRRSVRLSARPSITKLSQDWIISFFLILHMMIADPDKARFFVKKNLATQIWTKRATIGPETRGFFTTFSNLVI